jgi:drug/metabolite transporter (DMT)-like permease
MNIATLYIAIVFFWGTLYYAISFQVGAVVPEVAVVYRFALSGILVLGWCVWRRRRLSFTWRQHLVLMVQGAMMFSLTDMLLYNAIQYITSGVAALILSTLPIMNILFAALFLGMKIRRVVLLGALIGLVGMGMVFWPELAVFDPASAGLVGFSLCLVATVSASLAQIVSARNQRAGLPAVETAGICMLYGAGFSTLVCLALGRSFTWDWSGEFVLSFAYIVVICTLFSWVFYLILIGRVGPDRSSYVSILAPIVALIVSTLLEDFRWTPLSLAGAAAVLCGSLLVLASFRRRAAPA